MIFEHDYDFYETDESFDYPSPFGYDYTVNEICAHGITVWMDSNNIISKWSGYGHFDYEVSKIKTLPELKEYITNHISDLEEYGNSKYTNRELIDELLEFINENITQQAA